MKYALLIPIAALILLAALKHEWRKCWICGHTYLDAGAVARHVRNYHAR